MDIFKSFLDFFLHLDSHLSIFIQNYGSWTYLLLFLVLFCETGLVVTPILPGDSLLFAAGTFAAQGALNYWGLFLGLSIAAILGGAANCVIGRRLEPRALNEERWNFKSDRLTKTQGFFE